MRSVKMNRSELLDIVRKNKEKHILEYKEAVADYLLVIKKIAEQNVKIATSNRKVVEASTDLNSINVVSYKSFPQQPSTFELEYSRAIRMLELSVEDVIELEDHIFNQLVLDEWEWKHKFVASAALYKTMIR